MLRSLQPWTSNPKTSSESKIDGKAFINESPVLFRLSVRQFCRKMTKTVASTRATSAHPPLLGGNDEPDEAAQITTLIFDVDDTLYDVGTGFTSHRNGDAVQSFMVNKLHFPDKQSAKVIRDEYFTKYHSTAKALTVAEDEGRFPPIPDGGASTQNEEKRRFDPKDLAEWWSTNLNFTLLGGPDKDLVLALTTCPMNLVAFSNGPRKYVLRVLQEIGLLEIFTEERVFAVDDVLPYCKPEREAFDLIFETVGARAEECVMVEDSMKNLRMAKKLGMKTILVAGKGRMSRGSDSGADLFDDDSPILDDPSVDVCVETAAEIRDALPELWEKCPAEFKPRMVEND